MSRMEFFNIIGYETTEYEREILLKLDCEYIKNPKKVYFRVARGSNKWRLNQFMLMLVLYDAYFGTHSVEVQ